MNLRIALTGPPAAGKSTLAKLLSLEFDVAILDVAEILRRELDDGYRNMERGEIGPAFLAINPVEAIAEAIQRNLPPTSVAIDAVRLAVTLETLRENTLGLHHWHVDAPEHQRTERLESAHRSGAISADELKYKRSRERADSPEVDALRAIADYVFENDGTLDRFWEMGRGAYADATST